MKTPDYQTRWNTPRYQYNNDYLSTQPQQRKDSSASISQSRVTSRVPPRMPEPQPSLRKMASESGRKEMPMNNAEQTKIISALKSELFNLKSEVTKLISNDKDVGAVHTTIGVHQSQHIPKHSARLVEPQQYDGRQSMTIHTSHLPPQVHQYVNTHASNVQKKPSLQNEVDPRETTLKQVDILQVRQELRSSQQRQRKTAQERDDLARRLQERSKELDSIKLAAQNRSEKYANNKESNERSLNSIIEQLRKQHGEAERYYVKRIQELETGCREVENRLSSKEQEIMMLKQDINNLNSRVKEEESNIAINNSRYPRLIEQLQESNRSLTKEISELSERIRLEQERFYVAEQKISAAEMRATASEQKAVYAEHRANERVNMQDLTRQSMENEKKRLLEEIGQMRENNNKLLEETAKLREQRDQRIREKSREIDALNAEKDRLASARDELARQLEKQKEMSTLHVPSNHYSNNVSITNNNVLHIPAHAAESQKSEMSKSSIIVLNSGNPSLAQQTASEQIKRQEIEALSSKIEQLKKEKRTIQHDIKGLLETKEAIELSVRNLPQNKNMDELRNQLSQKDQAVNNLVNDVKNLQAELAKNARIEKKLKSNEALLREANEFIIRTELAVLNKKYVA